MNTQSFHRQLLDRIESELAEVEYFVTGDRRRQMALVFARIDRVRNREQAQRLLSELAREVDELDAREIPSRTTAYAWFAAAECA